MDAVAPAIRFGIFDWLDDDGAGPGSVYEHRLRLLEAADRGPFWCYHVAEHHGTPLGLAPSPNVFLAAAAARTRRIRLGAMVNVLPLYDPVRLVEEICMLDHLSGGRLELGVGRGGSPGELALFGVNPEQTRDMSREALEVVLAGLTTGRFEHEGRYFTRTGVSTPMRPVQKPYPPLWYPTSFPDSVPWIASEGMGLVIAFLLAKQGIEPREVVDRYMQAYSEARLRPGRLNGHVGEPRVGLTRHVVVAGTDAEARALARPALQAWFGSFNHLWVSQKGVEYWPSDVDAFMDQGHLIAGSPDTVRLQVANQLEASGANYFIAVPAFGDLPVEASLWSLDLFSREVIPRLRVSAPGLSD